MQLWHHKYSINMLTLWFVANSLLWPFNVELFGFKLGLNVIVLLLTGVVWMDKRASFSTFSVKVLLVLLIYFLSSYLVAIAGPCQDKFLKMALSAPVLFFMVLLGLEIGSRASDADWLKLQKSATWILVAAFAGLVVEMLFPGYFPNTEPYRVQGKYSGIFSEPSFVAISLFPGAAILLLAEGRSTRWSGVLALLGLLFLSYSSTLVVLIFCWVAYRLFVKGRQVRHTDIALGLLIGGVLISSQGAQTVERIAGVVPAKSAAGVVPAKSVENLSSLVYLQGWQDAWANLQRTNGLGLGFNMMGCHPVPDVLARKTVATVFHIELNTEDGSFLFSKLISEVGVVGILFFVLIVWWWIRLEKIIHKLGNGATPLMVPVAAAMMFCFVATTLLRSPGYFSGGLLLLVVAVAATIKWRRKTIQFDGAISLEANETDRDGQSEGATREAQCRNTLKSEVLNDDLFRVPLSRIAPQIRADE